MPKIELTRLKKIIREEMALLHEGDDHDAAAKNMTNAAKLLKAIEAFKESTSSVAKGELGMHLEEVEKTLNRIVQSPMKYVDVTTPPTQKQKVVTLKPEKKTNML